MLSMKLSFVPSQRGSENTVPLLPGGEHSEARPKSSWQNETSFPNKGDFWNDFAPSIEVHDIEEALPAESASVPDEKSMSADLNPDNEVLIDGDAQVQMADTTHRPPDPKTSRETGLESVTVASDMPEMAASSGVVPRSEKAIISYSVTDEPEAHLHDSTRRDQLPNTTIGPRADRGAFRGRSDQAGAILSVQHGETRSDPPSQVLGESTDTLAKHAVSDHRFAGRNLGYEVKFGQNAIIGQTLRVALAELPREPLKFEDTRGTGAPGAGAPGNVESSGLAKMRTPLEGQSTEGQHRGSMLDAVSSAAIARPVDAAWKTSDPKAGATERSPSFDLALSYGGPELVQRSPAPMQPAHTVLSDPKVIAIVRDALVEMSAKGQREIEIHLYPRELGKLRFLMVPSEGQISVQITADRAEILDALRRHAESFAQDLSSQGFGNAEFEFLQKGGDEVSLEHLDAPESTSGSPTGLEPEEMRWSIEAGRLDVRI
ncbi:flagellar hook-length control protein FliK [Rhodobacteraceae bacterium 63075]|nr:flagellar hook-length control protein FliK [Rhodobacteraceae bacterium 63075]